MGARQPGDIAALCTIARPAVGVVTNIGLADVGLLGGPAGIAEEKGALVAALPPDGLAVLDAGDAATPELAARTDARVVRVAVESSADIDAEVRVRSVALDAALRPSFVLDSPWGSGRICLAVRGAHQVVNASLAASVALANGVPFDAVVNRPRVGGARRRPSGARPRRLGRAACSTMPTTPAPRRWRPRSRRSRR